MARRSSTPDPLPSAASRAAARARGVDLVDRLRGQTVWLLIALVAAFLVYRVVQPSRVAATVLAHESRVLAVLRAIHDAQKAALAPEGGARARSLRDIALADTSGVFDGFVLRREGDVDLLQGDGYLVALAQSYPPEASRPAERTWTSQGADPDAGSTGYAAYAWPASYSIECQWAWFIDHRGRLLGGWNHQGRLDGTEPPFPPAVNPLRELNNAAREGEDGDWFVFEDRGEIVLPAPELAASSEGS